MNRLLRRPGVELKNLSATAEHKVLALSKASVSETGEFSGLGAAFGNVDDGGDIIDKGFFAPVIDEFLAEGFIAWGHDWNNPVAMPTAAEETDEGLMLSGVFHSHATAQEKRLITAERLAANKTMGLSIGYEVDQSNADDETGVRHLVTAKRLFEVSLVMVPMNRLAGVSGVKGSPYAEQADQLITDVRSLVERSKNLSRMRGKEGRVLSAANRERLESLVESLAAAMSDIRELLASTEAPDAGKAAALREAEIEFELTMARLDGHLPLH